MTENGRKCIMNFNDLAHGCTHTHARAGDKGFVRSELLKKFFFAASFVFTCVRKSCSSEPKNRTHKKPPYMRADRGKFHLVIYICKKKKKEKPKAFGKKKSIKKNRTHKTFAKRISSLLYIYIIVYDTRIHYEEHAHINKSTLCVC